MQRTNQIFASPVFYISFILHKSKPYVHGKFNPVNIEPENDNKIEMLRLHDLNLLWMLRFFSIIRI